MMVVVAESLNSRMVFGDGAGFDLVFEDVLMVVFW